MEFALALPIVLLLGLTGIEYANWTVTRMQVSQLALQLADNASRMGTAASGGKVVYEANISETFAGTQLQSGALDLNTKGRAFLSSLEPTDVTATAPTAYTIRWQRCYGSLTAQASRYGLQGNSKPSGMGATGQLVKPLPQGATMFAEVYYPYTPLFSSVIVPSTYFDETASMVVRDQRIIGKAPTATSGMAAATC
ncbi:TadE/TadG family type IV pilus assembly protein [Sphingomonas sp. R86520]|uniref:TadE/TadG family type IV pilus assembly protein n=1 Tax=Sphingomonas sp. R86520 TaxID=3093859 RepID=UPI0036D3A4C8